MCIHSAQPSFSLCSLFRFRLRKTVAGRAGLHISFIWSEAFTLCSADRQFSPAECRSAPSNSHSRVFREFFSHFLSSLVGGEKPTRSAPARQFTRKSSFHNRHTTNTRKFLILEIQTLKRSSHTYLHSFGRCCSLLQFESGNQLRKSSDFRMDNTSELFLQNGGKRRS